MNYDTVEPTLHPASKVMTISLVFNSSLSSKLRSSLQRRHLYCYLIYKMVSIATLLAALAHISKLGFIQLEPRPARWMIRSCLRHTCMNPTVFLGVVFMPICMGAHIRGNCSAYAHLLVSLTNSPLQTSLKFRSFKELSTGCLWSSLRRAAEICLRAIYWC